MSAGDGRLIPARSIATAADWEVTKVNVQFIGALFVRPIPTWSSSRSP